MFNFRTFLRYCVNGCKYVLSKRYHVWCGSLVSENSNRAVSLTGSRLLGEGDVSCSTVVNKGLYCPSFDIKYTRFWTIVVQKETPPQKCCHTTDGISPFSPWMFAVSTVCCVQCCCCIQTFTSPHFGLTVNMHGDGGSDGRVLFYSFWPKANILTYFPTITWHVHHWHKIVKNLKSKKFKKTFSVMLRSVDW